MQKEEMSINHKCQVVISSIQKLIGIHSRNRLVFGFDRGRAVMGKPEKEDAAAVFKEIANSGKNVKVRPHEYVEQLEKRYK